MGFSLDMKYFTLILLFSWACVSAPLCPEQGCPSEMALSEKNDPQSSPSSEVTEKSGEGVGEDGQSSGSNFGKEGSSKHEAAKEEGAKDEGAKDGGVSIEGRAPAPVATSFLWDTSSEEAPDTILIMSPSRYRDDLKLETWREMGQCSDCTQKFNVDLLTVSASAELDKEEWLKILAPMHDKYSQKMTLKVLVLPGLQDSFLIHLREIWAQLPGIERIILLDPGALEGLNGIVNITSTASKMSKSLKKIADFPSLEVLGLFNGRAFEKDRRRIMAGNSAFLYTELGMADKRGLDYLVEWFFMSRRGIKSPFSYGAASKEDVARIRGVSPAAWFQRSQGSLTEETSDDVLKLMLP